MMWTRKQCAKAWAKLAAQISSGEWRKEFDELCELAKAGDEEAILVLPLMPPGLKYPVENEYAKSRLKEFGLRA